MDGDGEHGNYGRTYTKGRRQPYLIRKWPGSQWALPLGPYTITQLGVFVGSVYVLLSYRDVWAHFGPFNLVIGVGVPIALTVATKHTRIEGRDPLRAGVALVSLLLQPRRGYLGDQPWRKPRLVRQPHGWFPVTHLPRGLAPALPAPVPPPARPPVTRWPRGSVADLVDEATRREAVMRIDMARRAEALRRAGGRVPHQGAPPVKRTPPAGGPPVRTAPHQGAPPARRTGGGAEAARRRPPANPTGAM